MAGRAFTVVLLFWMGTIFNNGRPLPFSVLQQTVIFDLSGPALFTTPSFRIFMNEQEFLLAIQQEAQASGINPLLLMAGIEGLYTLREVPAQELNFQLLDSLILTIFALRIGDSFDRIARENLESPHLQARVTAEWELAELSASEIAATGDAYLQSFAQMLGGKTPVRRYHRKALEVAAIEIQKAQRLFVNNSIGAIVFEVCRGRLKENLHLAALFGR